VVPRVKPCLKDLRENNIGDIGVMESNLLLWSSLSNQQKNKQYGIVELKIEQLSMIIISNNE
jgi:hypothetical protein